MTTADLRWEQAPGASRDVSTLRPEADVAGHLLTPVEVAELLSVSEAWVRRQAAARLVPCTRLGRQLRFTLEQVAQIVHAAEQPVAQLPAYGLTRRSRRQAG